MALTWNLGEIIGSEKVCWKPAGAGRQRELNPVTTALIHMTVNIGMPTLAKANAEIVFQRYSIYKALYGGKDTVITLQDMKQHAGLRTNAESHSEAKFKQLMWDALVRYAEQRVRNEVDVERKIDSTLDFLINRLEHMGSTNEAITELSKALGFTERHALAERIMSEWDALPANARIAMSKPEVHDLTIRKWVTAIVRG
jgi:hypothetical protein